jgi:serine/threonine protein kinase
LGGNLRYKSGASLGPWELLEKLGTGGNAEVWRARRHDGETVALKILKATRIDSEPYKRFRIEVDTLRQLEPRTGLLPLLDASLPNESSSRSPAWLAMPITTKIKAHV